MIDGCALQDRLQQLQVAAKLLPDEPRVSVIKTSSHM